MAIVLLFVSFCLLTGSNEGTKLGQVVNELTKSVDVITKENCVLCDWIEQHLNTENVDCNAIHVLFKSFTSNSIFPLYFRDICNIIWFYDDENILQSLNDKQKELKRLINEFMTNDNNHWQMFINDWICLGLDDTNKSFSDLLVYLHSDYTLASRKAIYETIQIDTRIFGDVYPQYRYILIAIFEYMSGIKLFNRFGALYNIYINQCNFSKCQLSYISKDHCDSEDNHIKIKQQFESLIIEDKETVDRLKAYGTKYISMLISMLNSFYHHQINHFDDMNLWN